MVPHIDDHIMHEPPHHEPPHPRPAHGSCPTPSTLVDEPQPVDRQAHDDVDLVGGEHRGPDVIDQTQPLPEDPPPTEQGGEGGHELEQGVEDVRYS